MNRSEIRAVIGVCLIAFFGWSFFGALKTGKTNIGASGTVRREEQPELFWISTVAQGGCALTGLCWLIVELTA
ncbi:MAG: hypothetical protein M3R41_02790 [Pseudomonadota bacterium]|nr:hypothetical protein [Pseudomonadota bacterium]